MKALKKDLSRVPCLILGNDMDAEIVIALNAWRTRPFKSFRADQCSLLLKRCSSSSLLLMIFAFLTAREHCRFGATCRRLRSISLLDHSWHSLSLGSAHLPNRRFNSWRNSMCFTSDRRVSSPQSDSDDEDENKSEKQQCAFCQSVCCFWNRMETARPVELTLQWRHDHDFVHLPKTDRLRKLTVRCLPLAQLPWLSQMTNLTEFQWPIDELFRHDKRIIDVSALISALPTGLHTLRLPHLHLSNENVQTLTRLPSLTDLALTCCLSAVEHLAALPLRSLNLKQISSGSCDDGENWTPSKILRYLSQLPLEHLTWLWASMDIDYCQEVATFLERRVRFPHLKTLDISAKFLLPLIEAQCLHTLHSIRVFMDLSILDAFPALTSLAVDNCFPIMGGVTNVWWRELAKRGLRHLTLASESFDEATLLDISTFAGLKHLTLDLDRRLEWEHVVFILTRFHDHHITVDLQSVPPSDGLNDAEFARIVPFMKGTSQLEIFEWSDLTPAALQQQLGEIHIRLIHENCDVSQTTLSEYMCPLDARRTLWQQSGLPTTERTDAKKNEALFESELDE